VERSLPSDPFGLVPFTILYLFCFSESRDLSRRRQSLATLSAGKARDSALGFTRTLRVTADNLDPVGVDLVRVVELKVDVFDYKRPDIVAKTVGIEVALYGQRISPCASCGNSAPNSP
jgi:hypothetical protein